MTTTTTLPAPVPIEDPDSAPFWAAAREGHLAIARCDECQRWQHPPMEVCRFCGGHLTFERVSGRGNVFSFIVVRQVTVPGHEPPYVVAAVQLDEDPSLHLTAVIRVPVDQVRVGDPVQVDLMPTGGQEPPRIEFVPASPAP
jgi:uncharacterized OB-fold protein